MKAPRKSSGLEVPQVPSWFGFLGSLPPLESLSCLLALLVFTLVAALGWQGCVDRELALMEVLLHFWGCSGLLMFAQCRVLYEHQGLFSLPEPITQQRSLSLSLSLLQKIQVLFIFFLLICSVFPGLFQHYPGAVLKLFNTP